ncbi:MAG: acyl carrier protein, partial [Oscillospiraceae bacterium]|nr:acyl carrier protein [Oscillospiraceae bacterium]
MDNTDKTIEKIINELSEIISVDPDELNFHTPLTAEYGVEPIDLAKLVIECERKFRVKIFDEDVHELLNVEDLALYIERR